MTLKKILLVMLSMMLMLYALPLITVGSTLPGEQGQAAEDGPPGAVLVSSEKEPETPQEENSTLPVTSLLQYDKKTTVTVSIQGQAQTISLHDYLLGVVAAEMPANFPLDALKAQAIAARTYTLYKIKLYEDGMDIPDSHNGAQLCDDPAHCKAYCSLEEKGSVMWGKNVDFYRSKIEAAVEETSGLIAVYEGQPIAAVFHAASAEKTEASVDVWGGDIPYLVSVSSPGGEDSPQYHSTVSMRQDDFAQAVLEQYPDADMTVPPAQWFKASVRSEAGGVIDVAVGGVRVTGAFIRKIAGLNSTNFRVQIEGENLVFTTVGYGHGVGMSQYGARAMALEGSTFDEIIKHYFPGVELLLKS